MSCSKHAQVNLKSNTARNQKSRDASVTCVAAFSWVAEQVSLDGGQFLANNFLLVIVQ